ncbi:MAG: hypothetical protein PHP64_02380 [Actinomycetota bacterium]|nr:hypothetical protein [Actinomycetota bacterium]
MRKKALRKIFSVMIVVSLSSIVCGFGCGTHIPKIEYARSARNVVLSMKVGSEKVHIWSDVAPCFEIYGDGKVLKRVQDPEFGVIAQGTLSYRKINSLLKEIAQDGFFSLEDEYSTEKVKHPDYSVEITINLKTARKKVCESGVKVPAIEEIKELLLDVNVENPKDYIPQTGFLTITALNDPSARILPAGSVVYSVLPDQRTIDGAISSKTSLPVEGKVFIEIKKEEVSQGRRGLDVSVGGKRYRVYPLYDTYL